MDDEGAERDPLHPNEHTPAAGEVDGGEVVDLDQARTDRARFVTDSKNAPDWALFTGASVYTDGDSGASPFADRSGERQDAGPGEWVVELPDPDREDPTATEGEKVDLPPEHYPASLALVMHAKDQARRPIVAPWLRSKAERHAVLLWTAKHYASTTAFHAVRCPWYATRLLGYAPRGLARLIGRWSRWLWDAEGAPVRAHAVREEDAGEYLRLSRQRDARVRLRSVLSLGFGFSGLVSGLVVWAIAPVWLADLTLAIATSGVGVVGAPSDRPIVESALVQFRNRKLTSDVVSRAFMAAGLTKKDQGISFPQPIRQDGQGWRVVVDMPYGKRFADAQNAHGALASGIDVAANQVFLDKDPSSERRVQMWVANEDPLAIPVGRTPLLKMERVDFWQPFPWGRDERGNEVAATLLWLSMLVGAVPRQGKTFSARTLALAAALDPHVRLNVFDGKASPDWRSFAKVAHRIGFGTVPRAGTDPADHLVATLLELKADVEDRYHRLSELPLHRCPEGKLTPELSRDKTLNMPLTLTVIDEVQEYLQHPELGKLILELLVYLVRVAPAVGAPLLIATQKPDDKACPPKLRDQCQARFSLRVGSYQVSEVILGAGSYGEGLDASRLERTHKGVGLLKGMTDTDGIVRTYLADGKDAEVILTRAHALRQEEGTLSGDAVGQAPANDGAATLPEDIAAVLERSEKKVWSETIVDRLATFKPELYGAWGELEGRAKADQLSTALKPYGIGTVQISRRNPETNKQDNKRGITVADLHAVITERNKKRAAS